MQLHYIDRMLEAERVREEAAEAMGREREFWDWRREGIREDAARK